VKEKEPKKVHLAVTHNLQKDCFLDAFGLIPLCGDKEATYLTDRMYNVTCKRCKKLNKTPKVRARILNEIGQKDFDKRMAYYYEIVWFAWDTETKERVIPKGYVPPILKGRKKRIP
jgi:hypothetical protein